MFRRLASLQCNLSCLWPIAHTKNIYDIKDIITARKTVTMTSEWRHNECLSKGCAIGFHLNVNWHVTIPQSSRRLHIAQISSHIECGVYNDDVRLWSTANRSKQNCNSTIIGNYCPFTRARSHWWAIFGVEQKQNTDINFNIFSNLCAARLPTEHWYIGPTYPVNCNMLEQRDMDTKFQIFSNFCAASYTTICGVASWKKTF
jgi:hypothetical protein